MATTVLGSVHQVVPQNPLLPPRLLQCCQQHCDRCVSEARAKCARPQSAMCKNSVKCLSAYTCCNSASQACTGMIRPKPGTISCMQTCCSRMPCNIMTTSHAHALPHTAVTAVHTVRHQLVKQFVLSKQVCQSSCHSRTSKAFHTTAWHHWSCQGLQSSFCHCECSHTYNKGCMTTVCVVTTSTNNRKQSRRSICTL